MSPSRGLAFEVLRLVEGGGHASDLLRSGSEGLEARDAGLSSEIVLGVLRFQSQLDYLIAHYSGRPADRLDLEVRLALRMGIYQLRYLDRIPRHASVNESVELVKRARKQSAAGLVNAVLRKVDRNPVAWPDRATEMSHPEWLLASWEDQFGAEGVEAIARAFLGPPESYLRVPEGLEGSASGLQMEATSVAGCFRYLSGDASAFRQQDISSQAMVPLLRLEPGQTFLDLCAAPGNKTAQVLESAVRAVACDVSVERLRGLEGLDCQRVALDGTYPLPFQRRFDRILVDAPCSGTGTLGRNPEIKWRIQPSDLDRQHVRQARLLGNALNQLAAGGRLVYATCSLQREENQEVVEEVMREARTELALEDMVQRVPGLQDGDGFFAAVITSE